MKRLGLKHEEITQKPSSNYERSSVSRFASYFVAGAAVITALATGIGLPRNVRAQEKPAAVDLGQDPIFKAVAEALQKGLKDNSNLKTMEIPAKDILAAIQAVSTNKYELVIPKMEKRPFADTKLAKIPIEGGKSTILLSPNGTIFFYSRLITETNLNEFDRKRDDDYALPGFTPDSSGHEKMTLLEVPFTKVNGEKTSFVVYATSYAGFIVFARDYNTNKWRSIRSYWPYGEAERAVLENPSVKPTLGILKDSDGNFDIFFVSPSTLQGVVISFYPPTSEEPEIGISKPGLVVPKPLPTASLR
jgi:hypothetical protein